MSTKNTKQRLHVTIKQVSADGTFDGLLAVYGNVDLGGDVVVQGAFTKTLQEHGSQVPLLWQHKTDQPIGTLTLTDTPTALNCTGTLLLELPDAQKAYSLLKAGVIKGLSIGYDTIKDTVDNGVRFLKELRLWEGSIVTFPMNEMAIVTAVKAYRENKADFNTELASQQIADMGQQIFSALYYALTSLTWSTGSTAEEKISAASETLTQFVQAYMSYLPAYLDWLDAEYGPMETMSRARMSTKMLRAVAQFEVKEGREFSAANTQTLKDAHGHVKDIDSSCMKLKSIFETLLPAEAVDDDDDIEDDEPAPVETPDDDDQKNAGTPAAKAATKRTEPESGPDHSEALKTVDSLLDFVRARKAS